MIKKNFNCIIDGLYYTIVNRLDCYQAIPYKQGHANIPTFFVMEKKHTRQDIIDCLDSIRATK